MTQDSLIVAKKVNNRLVQLDCPVRSRDRVELVPLASWAGLQVYERSLILLLVTAVKSLYPGARLLVEHSLSRGLYCELLEFRKLRSSHVRRIEKLMKRLVKADQHLAWLAKDARGPFNPGSKTCPALPLVPSTGFLKVFALKYYPPGFILRLPRMESPDRLPQFRNQPKLFRIFHEYEKWARILGVDDVNMLNAIVTSERISKFIQVSEALHEKKIARIADEIVRNRRRIKLVFIAGPSGAGKTTFSKRLSIQLLVNEIPSTSVSIDNYFVEREDTPKDESGRYDFETIRAIDIDLLASQIGRLLSGTQVMIPEFSFHTGRRKKGRPLRLARNEVLIIEGIHGLNEEFLCEVPRAIKFKIYINALTQLNINDYDRISTTDTRMIRRVVRDSLFRGYEPGETIKRWYQIRRGEEQNIYPFQEDADAMFNSALVYELAVLKTYAEPTLSKIRPSHLEFSEACRILEIFRHFKPVAPAEVPPTSILREFIGGSSFLY